MLSKVAATSSTSSSTAWYSVYLQLTATLLCMHFVYYESLHNTGCEDTECTPPLTALAGEQCPQT
jgi:hypothetical protein